MYLTYGDAVEVALGYVGGNPVDAVVRDAKRAVLEAYREIANAARWSYYYHHGRVITNPPFISGTIQYIHSGGQYPRMVVLTPDSTGALWPSWAGGGYLRLSLDDPQGDTGLVNYRVSSRVSGTILTLDDEVNPGQDIQAGQQFKLYQDTYLLPADYIAQDQALYERNFGGMTYTHPREWLYENRYVFSEGVPQCYTITGDPQYPGRLVIRIFPFPDDYKTLDFIYQRRPRALAVSCMPGSGSVVGGLAVVTATTGLFNPSSIGSIVRLSANANPPTNEVGRNPAAFESQVVAYLSPTQVSVADTPTAAMSGALVVSDPIDIEQGAMANAFLRCVENQMAVIRVMKDRPFKAAEYQAALARAKAADSRSFAGRAEGPQNRLRRRLRDMPIDLSQTY